MQDRFFCCRYVDLASVGIWREMEDGLFAAAMSTLHPSGFWRGEGFFPEENGRNFRVVWWNETFTFAIVDLHLSGFKSCSNLSIAHYFFDEIWRTFFGEKMTHLSGFFHRFDNSSFFDHEREWRMRAPAMSTLHLSGFDHALSFQPLIIFRGNESPSAPLQCFTLFPNYFCSEPSDQERCRNLRHTMLTLGPRLHLCVCVYNYISCLIAWTFQPQLNRPSRSVDSGKILFRPYPSAPL